MEPFTLNFSRTAGNQPLRQNVVINGGTYTFNKTLNPIRNGSTASTTVRVRLVGDSVPTSYSMWIDQMSLTY